MLLELIVVKALKFLANFTIFKHDFMVRLESFLILIKHRSFSWAHAFGATDALVMSVNRIVIEILVEASNDILFEGIHIWRCLLSLTRAVLLAVVSIDRFFSNG